MRLSKQILGLAAVGCLSLGLASQAHAGRYIVLYKQHALPNNMDAVVQQAGGTVAARLPSLGIAIVESSAPNFDALMGSAPGVHSVGPEPAFAVPEYVSAPDHVPDAPSAGTGADLYELGLLWGIDRVRAPAAWAAGVTGSHDTVVAVIDTGLAWNHPALAGNIVHVACFTSAGHAEGFDTTGDCNPYPTLSDHGTHVAGTVAAVGAPSRIVGVGPNLGLAGYNTFEVIPDCGVCAYTSSRWLAQLDAAERGYKVINMSLGGLGVYGGGRSDGLATFVAADARVQRAVINAGTTIVASGGNANLNLNGIFINLPGGLPGVVNTGATGIQPNALYEPGVSYDIRAFYSNYGASITIAAPGGDCGQVGRCDDEGPDNWFEYLVLSSIVAPSAGCAATASCPVGYGWKGGTSMAAPHAAGVVGLIRDENPDLTAAQAANVLARTAENLRDRQQFGLGMVDARGAIGK
jgi:lantibiotic leader peptide-processing serine protease